jgi:hypothetical protein
MWAVFIRPFKIPTMLRTGILNGTLKIRSTEIDAVEYISLKW